MWRDHLTEIIVTTALFLGVSAMGFVAARWRRADSMAHLDEWGLGGRNFGGWITWFLVGGDLYTAYTFVAVPALLFGAGATGFFAVPYTIIIYPLVFLVLCRLWSVSHRHGFVTPADFVRARTGSSTMALLVAITGIVATMPYIALQLVGIEAVVKAMRVPGSWPLIVAFIVLAAYTYQSGLRAPALIAFVKDILIYLVIIVAIIYIPSKLGGWSGIFGAAKAKFDATPATTDGITLNGANQWQYITLAFGSALALFLHPHSITGVLASKSRDVIKRNMSALPAYSLLLGLIALLGYMAIAAKVAPLPGSKPNSVDSNTVVPVLFDKMFPSWFAGIAFAAVAIGALVPAAIMSIAAANTFTRNIYREWIKPDATHAEEANASKIVSLLVKGFALVFVLTLDKQNAINFQLLGGIWILQTFPAIVFGLYTRWFHHLGLLAGWAGGMFYGTYAAYNVINPVTGNHFAGSLSLIPVVGQMGYIALTAFAINSLIAAVLTVLFDVAGVPRGADETVKADYFADKGDPRVGKRMASDDERFVR